MRWKFLSVVCLGVLGLVGACSDDSSTPGGNNNGNEAGAGGQNGGGEGVACPTALADLMKLGGKACGKEGEQCDDPAAGCEHNFSYQCKGGKWEALIGLTAPCDGGAGGGGAGPGPFVCPTDAPGLQALKGKACSTDKQVCNDPAPPCEHDFSVECIAGKWEQLDGVLPLCEGGAGGGGAGGAGGASSGGAGGEGGK